MRALILEDDVALSFVWQETLEDSGYTCTIHRSCAQAEKDILLGGFDLFLLDLFVEDGNSIDLSSWIRLRYPVTPIIMLTGSRVFANGQHTENAAAADWFLRKPVAPLDLKAMIEYLAAQTLRSTANDIQSSSKAS